MNPTLTTENAEHGLTIRHLLHREWGTFTLKWDGHYWNRYNTARGYVALLEDEFMFWIILKPACPTGETE